MFSMKCFVLAIVVQVLIVSCVVNCDDEMDKVNKAFLAPYLNKKYELVTSDDKFDDIMKALGVGALKRNLAKLAKPVIELTENGDEYILKSDSSFKNTETKFKIGKEFEEETPDGRNVKSLVIQDRNKLIQTQRGDKTTTIIREFSGDEVKVTVKVDDITSVRTYKRV